MDIVDNKLRTFPKLITNILICFLLLIQLFPPLWIQDITSLRHFLIALFDISAIGVILVSIFKQKIKIVNPLRFLPIAVFLLLLVVMGISISWAINIVEAIAVWNRWILVFLVAFLVGIILDRNTKLLHTLIYCTMIITFINILTCIIGYYHFDLHISQRHNLMLNGGYGNKNIFAICLALKLPLLYYAIICYKRIWKILSLVLVLGVCFCLMILSTRSTFVSMFLQIVILLCYCIYEKFVLKAKNKHFLLALISIGVVIIGFFAGNQFIQYNYNKYAKHDVKNNYTLGARVKTIEQGNSKGRLLIWRNTLEIIKKEPIKGYGIGNHKLNIMRVEAAKKKDYVVSDHAHNDFLEMQSELGIVGELLYILLYISMGVIGLRVILNKKTHETYRLIALVSILMLVTYAIDALFNFPNERATPQIYFALSFALMMLAYNKSKGETKEIKQKKVVFISLAVLMIGLLYIESCHFVSSIVQHRRILCSNSRNKNNIPPSYWVNAAPWLPNIDESTKPIAINNASMFALEGDYRTAIDMVLNDNSNPFYGLKEYRLASYYSHLGMLDSSFYWAEKCIKVKPLCYDPVNVEVGNYKKMGDTLTAIKILEDYLTRETSEPRAWKTLINIYAERGDIDKAAEVYDKFFVYNKENKEFSLQKETIKAIEEVKKQQK